MQITKKNMTFGVATVAALVLIGLARPAITAVYSNPVRDVDNPGRAPVQHGAMMTLNPGTGSMVESTPYTVPAGARLVIDTISAKAIVPTGQSIYVDIGAGSPFVSLYVPLSPFQSWSGSESMAMGTGRVQAYADAGTAVTCSTQRLNSDDSGTDTVYCYWTGHLVYLP